MSINEEFITLIVAIVGGCAFLWNKLDQIRRELATIREDYVKHSVCAERRKECLTYLVKEEK
ncbi:hypothetical protein P0136_11410 [Lentisphaerota bacterium ZTH]|nr:hypothetical protein JYG24_11070 [Lentisphaerota bacterium]WET05965.1 hypothetical protein P0136_11410 [Lentisphaerota bacterium ZTH]